MVGVGGLEPPASWSRTKRATSCATPRKPFHYMTFPCRCQELFLVFPLQQRRKGEKAPLPSHFSVSCMARRRQRMKARVTGLAFSVGRMATPSSRTVEGSVVRTVMFPAS